MPEQASGLHSTHVPEQAPGLHATHVPEQASGLHAIHVPGQAPGLHATHVPGQAPGLHATHVPGLWLVPATNNDHNANSTNGINAMVTGCQQHINGDQHCKLIIYP